MMSIYDIYLLISTYEYLPFDLYITAALILDFR